MKLDIAQNINIITRDFGQLEVAKDSLITFPQGLFAFQDDHVFALLSPLGADVSPMWLQSAAAQEPCFIVYKLDQLVDDYAPHLDANAKKIINLQKGDDIVWMGLVQVPQDDFKKSTINLKSPIAINANKRLGLQLILDGDLPMRHPIFAEGTGE